MEEPYVCYWDVHPESDIRVCNNGEVEGTTEIHHGALTIRKNGRRYQVAKLILETFDNEEENGNYKGRGTVVWKDENQRNNHIDNLRFHWRGAGWSREALKTRDQNALGSYALKGPRRAFRAFKKAYGRRYPEDSQAQIALLCDKEELRKRLIGGC